MRAVLTFTLAAALCIAGAWWLASLPGIVPVTVGDLSISAPTPWLLIFLALLFVVIYFVVRLIVWVITLPRRAGRRSGARRLAPGRPPRMNQIDLKGRVAVITGGAQGIGYAIAQRMLASGANVVLWDADAAKLEEAKASLAGAGTVFVEMVELTSEQEVEAATQRTLAAAGKIDILVNNAGITGGNATTWELSPEVWRRVIEVNLVAPYLVCRAVVPHMIAAKYGRIVNIASVAGKEGNPNASHYSASKAGVIALTKSLGKELATKGVIVNAITPAAAKTAMFATMTQQHIDFMLSKIPMGRFLEVDEAAAMVAWLASEECSFTTGSVIDISGGRATY